MFRRRTAAAILPLAAALAVSAAARPAFTAVAPPPMALMGPPWISIEYPANPFDRGSRGAYLLVHAFHHGTPTAFPVSGAAEGLVRGERRTVPLTFTPAGRAGVYALRKQWSDEGVWTLVVRVTQGSGDAATALVELAPSGEVARVEVPTARHREGDFPRAVTAAEVDAGLRARAGAGSVR
jgi:hypothetical protein